MANRRFVSRAPKRRMSWEGAAIDASDLVVATPQRFTVMSEALLENFPTPTLVRTRGKLTITTDASSTPGSVGKVALGLIFVTGTALAAAAVPLPETDVGNDWLWIDSAVVGSQADDSIGGAITVERLVVDSKAMRKVANNTALVLVMQVTLTDGSAIVANVAGSLRFLLKAP